MWIISRTLDSAVPNVYWWYSLVIPVWAPPQSSKITFGRIFRECCCTFSHPSQREVEPVSTPSVGVLFSRQKFILHVRFISKLLMVKFSTSCGKVSLSLEVFFARVKDVNIWKWCDLSATTPRFSKYASYFCLGDITVTKSDRVAGHLTQVVGLVTFRWRDRQGKRLVCPLG